MSRQITTFTVSETLLGLDILVVKEAYRRMELTPIPDAPKQMSGLMNLRGRVVTVIDLDACLNQSNESIEKDRILLILKTNQEIQQYQQKSLLTGVNLGEDIVGLLIDRMDDVLDIEEEDILPTPPNLDTVDRQLIEGVVKLENQLVLLLDINAVLERMLNIATKSAKN